MKNSWYREDEIIIKLAASLSASAFMRHLLSLKSPRVRLLLAYFTLWPHRRYEASLPGHILVTVMMKEKKRNFEIPPGKTIN